MRSTQPEPTVVAPPWLWGKYDHLQRGRILLSPAERGPRRFTWAPRDQTPSGCHWWCWGDISESLPEKEKRQRSRFCIKNKLLLHFQHKRLLFLTRWNFSISACSSSSQQQQQHRWVKKCWGWRLNLPHRRCDPLQSPVHHRWTGTAGGGAYMGEQVKSRLSEQILWWSAPSGQNGFTAGGTAQRTQRY